MNEPKQVVQEEPVVEEVKEDFDSKADEFFNQEKETPEESSASEETEETKTEETEDAGEDQPKTSKKSEEETEEESDKDPKDLMFRKGYNEAKAKAEKELEELRSKTVDSEKLKEFERVTSSPAFIRSSMREQGYTEEAINNALVEKGHKVETGGNDEQLIYQKLGVNPETLDEQTKAIVSDVSKIVDILVKDRLDKTVPEALKPIQETLQRQESEKAASGTIKEIQSTITKENILDYKTDIEPELNKWLDENPTASQQDFKSYFKDLNHELTIKRLQTHGKKQARDEKKGSLRTSKEGVTLDPGKLPAKTGDYDTDADTFLDAIGSTN